ncbi:MAG TPA: glycosyltransferase, partial [Puia sp.]|nr:glycosyltransferase [Puia sp.]
QIIVVNDHSTDHTEKMVRDFPGNRVDLINLSEVVSENILSAHKKKAIETAIARASGKLILTTDADCKVPKEWVQSMVNLYGSKNAKFIAAPVKIAVENSLVSIFQTLDFITLQGITGASVSRKLYSMCNGANLAYEKDAFYGVDGFLGIDSIASGDDMLLMHKIFLKYPDSVQFLKSEEAIVLTKPASSWRSFIQQRIRWSSKADQYKDKAIFRTLLFVYIFNLSLLAFLIGSIWHPKWLIYFLILIVIKTIVEFPFVYNVAAFFRQQKLMTYFFFLQPLHILYIVVVGFLGKFSTFTWKGRRLR